VIAKLVIGAFGVFFGVLALVAVAATVLYVV
jgi:hypothetical protein